MRGNLAILGTELSTVPRRRKRHPIAAFGSLRLSGGSDALIGNVRPKTSQMIAGRLDIAEAFGALSLKTKCRRKIRTIAGRKLKSFRNEWIHINLHPAFSQTRLVRGALLGNSFAPLSRALNASSTPSATVSGDGAPYGPRDPEAQLASRASRRLRTHKGSLPRKPPRHYAGTPYAGLTHACHPVS